MTKQTALYSRAFGREEINRIVMYVFKSLHVFAVTATYRQRIDTLCRRACPVWRHYACRDICSDGKSEIAVDGIYRLIMPFKHTYLLVVSVA